MTRLNSNRVILIFLIIQSIGAIILAFFVYSFVTDPKSALNESIASTIRQYADNFKPLEGLKGDKGEQGLQGDPGINGRDGSNGLNGTNGANGVDGQAGQQGIQGLPGEKGDTGEKGEPGEPAPRAQFRCNPDTARDEYKYPDDEDWMETGGSCVPVVEEESNV